MRHVLGILASACVTLASGFSLGNVYFMLIHNSNVKQPSRYHLILESWLRISTN